MSRRCTCGWTRFRTTRSRVGTAVQRWVRYVAPEPFAGMGSQEAGTAAGGGDTGFWGLFDATLNVCADAVTCENCTRVRQSSQRASGTIFGGYATDSEYIVVASDIDEVGCFSLLFTGPITIEVGVKLRIATPLPIVMGAPLTGPQISVPAEGMVANTLLYAPLPVVPLTGDYAVTLENRCCT